jgi:peptidoglycan-N-acetylglucosamine deacetylase
VALTFDAEHLSRPGGRPGGELEVLDILRGEGVRATFFLQGRWARAYPEVARRIAGDGHVVGSHSHQHARMPHLTDEGLRADIVQAGRAIREAAGVDPRPHFRCPWGHGARDARVVMALRAQRYRHVGWDVTAEDWDPDRSPAQLVEEVLAAVRAQGDGAVVLLHAWPVSTVEALPGILEGLRGESAAIVTVEDLADRDLTMLANPQAAADNPNR